MEKMTLDVMARVLREATQRQTEIGRFLAEPGQAYVTCREIGTERLGDHSVAVCALACSREPDDPPSGPLGARLTISAPDGGTETCFLDEGELKGVVAAFRYAASSTGAFGGMRVAGKERGELAWRTLAGLKLTLCGEPGSDRDVAVSVLELGRVRLETAGCEVVWRVRELLSSAASHVAEAWANRRQ